MKLIQGEERLFAFGGDENIYNRDFYNIFLAFHM